jgi:hypothetical protein
VICEGLSGSYDVQQVVMGIRELISCYSVSNAAMMMGGYLQQLQASFAGVWNEEFLTEMKAQIWSWRVICGGQLELRNWKANFCWKRRHQKVDVWA